MREGHMLRRGRERRPAWFRLPRSQGRRGERGATLIEFAIVGLPFFMLLFGTLEVGFVFWGMYDLENATEDAARRIRTGQVQAAGTGEAEFKTLVCSKVTLLSQCTSKLRLDVRNFNAFGEIAGNLPAPLDDEGELKETFNWQPGGPGSIVLVTSFYEWPLLNIVSSISLSNMANGDRLLRASAAFRNENWPAPPLPAGGGEPGT